MARKHTMKSQDWKIRYRRSKWVTELQMELEEVTILYEDLKDMNGVNVYLKKRKHAIEEQLAWLSIYIKKIDEQSKEEISG